ncbi:lytic transglycosylase domain-containing protein [Ottowia testudinis]|uniref:Lytic transglycosylase domain-containing protein n=2 Tax=Ottowia testudinis TaxID=2816950 RepID=A0A975H530_9BURK|nr:lytic transglycosylase domain-containing protein [Ottowia testudinis]
MGVGILLVHALHADADEVWQILDGDGVIHMGNAVLARSNGRPQSTLSESAAPEFVEERGLTWINHTWRLRYPAYDPVQSVVTAAPVPMDAGSGFRWPRGYEAVKPYLDAAARNHSVEPALVIAVAAAESAFNVEAVSHKGALGLMQIMPGTAERYGVSAPALPGERHAVLEPQVNAQVGSRYLADLLRMFGGDKSLALAAYNAGEGAVAKYGNRIPPYPETQRYVEKVMRFYRTLSQ